MRRRRAVAVAPGRAVRAGRRRSPLPAAAETELIARPATARRVGRFVRRREPVDGRGARRRRAGPTPIVPYRQGGRHGGEHHARGPAEDVHRDDVMAHSLIAVHTMLAVDDGTVRLPARSAGRAPPPAAAHLSQRRGLPGAHRRRRRCGAVVADHPLRPPRGRPAEPGRPLRLPGDRRDPGPAGHDADRRGEVRGPGHRPPGRGHHRPLRRHVARDAERPARADAPVRSPSGLPDEVDGPEGFGGSRPSAVPPSPGGIPRSTRRSIPGPSRCGSPASRSPRGARCGCRRRTGPTPRTSSCRAWPPPWPACSPMSTVTSTSPSRSTTIRPPRSWCGRGATSSSTLTRSSRWSTRSQDR